MTDRLETTRLASGPGWFVQDVRCNAGPADRPYEEEHASFAVATVASGSFSYRTTQGRGTLVPGAVLLGNMGAGFACSHEHGSGDRCISCHFSASLWEQLAAELPRGVDGRFRRASLPPSDALLHASATLIAAREFGPRAVEESALAFATTAAALAMEAEAPAPAAADRRRVIEAARFIADRAASFDEDGELSLDGLARQASMSRYHFLRIFRREIGMTPWQYVLHLRMQRAAILIRTTREPLLSIALNCGFNDLSTFGRRFRRLMGTSPGAYRSSCGRA